MVTIKTTGNTKSFPDTHTYYEPAIKLAIKINLKIIYFAIEKLLNIASKLIKNLKSMN